MSDATVSKQETLEYIESSIDVKNITVLNSLVNYYKKTLKFRDKSNRKEYLVGMIFQWLMSVVFFGLIAFGISLIAEQATKGQMVIFNIFQWVFWLLVFFPSFALTFRRSYSATGKAWLATIYYVSIVASMFLYTAALALTTFSAEYISYFYGVVVAAMICLIISMVSFATLLFKKAKN